MLRVGDPGSHALLDFELSDAPVLPAVPQAPQTVAEATDILLRETAAAARQKDEAQEGGGLAGRRDVRLVRVKAQAPTLQVPLDLFPPLGELVRIVVEENEVVHVAHVPPGPQHLLAEVVEAIKVEVREKLAGEVADGQAAPPFEGGEEVVGGEVEVDGLLRVGAVDDAVGEVEGALAGDPAAKVALEDGVVDGGEVAEDVAAEHVPAAVAELLVAGHRAVGAFPLPVGVGVEDEAALEDGLRDRAEGVVDDPVAEGRRRDHAVLGVEDLDHGVAARPVAARPEFPLEAQDLLLQIGEEGGRAGL